MEIPFLQGRGREPNKKYSLKKKRGMGSVVDSLKHHHV
jgi:hypothetical protein